MVRLGVSGTSLSVLRVSHSLRSSAGTEPGSLGIRLSLGLRDTRLARLRRLPRPISLQISIGTHARDDAVVVEEGTKQLRLASYSSRFSIFDHESEVAEAEADFRLLFRASLSLARSWLRASRVPRCPRLIAQQSRSLGCRWSQRAIPTNTV